MIPELTPPSLQDCEADSHRLEAAAVSDTAGEQGQADASGTHYQLDEQIGYLLRLANQRHLEIFNDAMPSLTPAQFAMLVRLDQEGDISQNELGRSVGIDAATTKGVIERLARKKLVTTRTDVNDKRRLRISLTDLGQAAVANALPVARDITQRTLCQLDTREAEQLIQLLKKLQKS